MKTRFLAVLLSLCASSLVYAAESPPVGQAAPDFTAQDINGKTVKLSDLKGKPVVLEWSNHECPFVRKHYDTGNMQALQKDATQKGVVWITLVSSAPGREGYVTVDEAKSVASEEGAAASIEILDTTGTIGHEYGARATPNMFVIDPAGILVYEGAIDDKPTTDKSDVASAHNYVRAALEAIASHQAVAQPVTSPYGCSIKYGG